MSVINDTLLAIKSILQAGINLVNGGNAVSKTNPLPTTQLSSLNDRNATLESDFLAVAYSVAAGGAGNYAKTQIWNPVGSGKKIIVYTAITWHTSGTVIYQTSLTNVQLSTALGVTVQNMCAGSSNAPVAVLGKQNDQATLTTLFTNKASHSTLAQNSTAGNILSPIGVLKAGQGFNVEANTANIGFNGVFGWLEMDDLVD